MRPLDVGIIGAGTAGNAAAIILARDGHRVTLYERAPTPSPVGAGLLMQPSGLAVLEKLGLDRAVRESGARVDTLRCVTTGGRSVFTLDYRDLVPDLHGIGLHRGVLFATLFDAARASGMRLITGVTIASLANHGRGKLLIGDDGTCYGPHDLVIMASGSRNAVADDEAPVRRPIPYPWGALWFVAKTSRVEPELFQVLHGTRRMLGLVPVGNDLVTVFWSVPVASRDRALMTMREDIAAHY
ncbi:MAG TPA: FAD-dependent monooxygenase, partial [Myxococcota bacterium]|nr:FAD-dependent monooxygenase [Myxococcota bacterium]